MRWVAWVVVVSACAKPSGGTLAPTPAASEASTTANAAPSTAPPEATAIARTAAIEAQLALPSASAVVGSSKRGNCLVTVGDLEIIRPCEGKPNERKEPTSKAATPSPKMCKRVEHTADGDIVSLQACPK